MVNHTQNRSAPHVYAPCLPLKAEYATSSAIAASHPRSVAPRLDQMGARIMKRVVASPFLGTKRNGAHYLILIVTPLEVPWIQNGEPAAPDGTIVNCPLPAGAHAAG
jgi:hypothetical protein